MTQATIDRLIGWRHAFDHPVTVGIVAVVAGLLIATPFIVWLLVKLGKVPEPLRIELMKRYWSWVVMVPLIAGPILLGGAFTIFAMFVLSLLCYREYARATGLFREKTISLVVVIGIVLQSFAALDHWYRLFVALVPLTVGVIAITAILKDQPQGYIQRVALGVLGFLLMGTCFAHISYMANDGIYRPILLWLFLCVEMNDVFAFISGKSFGKRKIAPNTSPKKTLGGAIGAVVLTTILASVIGRFVFRGTEIQSWPSLIGLGVLISVLGQFGDLMLSSIKRDLGLKDLANTIPGHGGLLDRFDSLILVAPGVFHFVNYFVGFGRDQDVHAILGG